MTETAFQPDSFQNNAFQIILEIIKKIIAFISPRKQHIFTSLEKRYVFVSELKEDVFVSEGKTNVFVSSKKPPSIPL